jgi:hypothetical protein
MVSEEDLPPFDCPPEVWNIAEEVHFRQAPAERVTQARQIYGDSTLNAHPLHLRNSFFAGDNVWVAMTENNMFAVEPDGTWSSIVDTANEPATVSANDFTSCELNGVPVFNYGGKPVYWLRDPLTDSDELPDWPAGSTCAVIRSYKNYLIALNVFDTNDYPSLIRWSDAAEPGTIPASWTPGTTTDAGEFSAGGSNEGITDGLALRDVFMVYKPHASYVMQYVGGNSIMSLRQLSETMGALAANCVAELNGNHIILGQGDVYITDGQTIRSLVKDKVRVKLFREMDETYFYESYVVANPLQNEVWICFPEVGQKYASRALIWHSTTNQFSWRSLLFGDATGSDAGSPHMAFGNTGELLSGELNWDDRTTNWDTDTATWNEYSSLPSISGLLAIKMNATANTGLILMDAPNGQDTSLVSKPALLQKLGMDLGSRDSVKYVSEVWPRITGTAGTALVMRVGGQMEPDDLVFWGPYVDYVIGVTRKIDTRVTARFLAFEIASDDVGVWRITGMDVNAIEAGRY